MAETILAATTDADQTTDFGVSGPGFGNTMPAHFKAPGIAGAEVATIQYKSEAGDYYDYYVDGVLQTITATNSGIVVDAPGVYRVDKDATAAAVPIEVSHNRNP